MARTRWLVLVTTLLLILSACGSSGDEDADPSEVLGDYVAAYNSGDADAVMALFTEDSVVTGHPFANEQRGLASIRQVTVGDIAAAASTNAYTISNVVVTGNTVTWDHVWTNSDGSRFCKYGQSAVIEDGKILSWTWAGGGFDCR